ncbi:MAG: Rne/Rng family ribonuclease [Bacteroidales bacterium]|nr:Rne/Rng family ribonuclease [Bacteroidales bacterium]
MSNELIISVNTPEINIALLENKQLVELYNEKTNSGFAVGDIYIAKVKKVVSGLNAVFVDLGYEKDAFLHYHDLGPQFNSLSLLLSQVLNNKAYNKSFSKFSRVQDIDKNGNISDVIKAGQLILVQVAKEPISSKGPRLSSEISIAGRNLVLLPFSDKVSISSKIESVEEKARLKKLVQSIKPNNYGVIVRTACVGKNASELATEILGLAEKWEKALIRLKKINTSTPKLVLSELDRVSALLRDILSPSFNNIVIDNKELFEETRDYLKEIAPEKEKIVKEYVGKVSLFDNYGIDKQVKSLFDQNVAIKNGAYLIIQHTEALHVIDVNSGNRTKFEKDQESNALDVNTAAALEIARQLRLRDMGGIIVIDFIDMKSPENKAKLYEAMKNAMASDRAKHNILPLSKFGLMQITRQRVRPELTINTKEVCPCCKGKGEISTSSGLIEKIEDDLKHIVKLLKFRKIKLVTHPIIAGYLSKGLIPIKMKWQLKYYRNIKIQSSSKANFLEYSFYDDKDNKINL